MYSDCFVSCYAARYMILSLCHTSFLVLIPVTLLFFIFNETGGVFHFLQKKKFNSNI
jgi:hypothetical protein